MAYVLNCIESSDLTETDISILLLGLDSFGSQCLETKFQAISS